MMIVMRTMMRRMTMTRWNTRYIPVKRIMKIMPFAHLLLLLLGMVRLLRGGESLPGLKRIL